MEHFPFCFVYKYINEIFSEKVHAPAEKKPAAIANKTALIFIE
jgi:hypothetical protein